MKRSMKYFQQSARECAALISNGSLCAKDYCKEHLDCIDKLNAEVNAMRFVDSDGALERAGKLSTNKIGRLSGLTFAAKDHIDVAGLPQSLGTLRGAVGSCSHNAAAIELLLKEGAICLGKTNMPELAKSYSTANRDFGRTNNPHNLELTPGGSSGGDAAAVASGMVDFAIGADSSGSLRIPSNFCGVFSLYPTLGTISHAGLSSYAHTTLSLFRSLGPITRSIDDLELLQSILCKFDPNDPHSIPFPHSAMVESMPTPERNLKGKYLWFSQLGEVQAHPDIQHALSTINKGLSQLGFTGIENTPELFLQCLEPYVILGIQTSLEVDDLLGHTSPGNESDNLIYLRKALEARLPKLSVETVLKAWHAVGLLRSHVHALFHDYDFIVSPVAATPAVPHNTTEYELHGKTHETQDVYLYSSVANILGIPAISFPTHKNDDGIPIGLQVMGPRFSDRLLIQLVRDLGFSHAL